MHSEGTVMRDRFSEDKRALPLLRPSPSIQQTPIRSRLLVMTTTNLRTTNRLEGSARVRRHPRPHQVLHSVRTSPLRSSLPVHRRRDPSRSTPLQRRPQVPEPRSHLADLVTTALTASTLSDSPSKPVQHLAVPRCSTTRLHSASGRQLLLSILDSRSVTANLRLQQLVILACHSLPLREGLVGLVVRQPRPLRLVPLPPRLQGGISLPLVLLLPLLQVPPVHQG